MQRRALFLFAPLLLSADGPKTVVRGKFSPVGQLTTPRGKVRLKGDEESTKVFGDKRLEGVDFEALGHFTKDDEFVVDPIHTRALWAYRDGQRLMVTYWCPVCYIRTYSPGICWCCQDDTKLDFKDPSAKDPTP